MNRYQLTIEPAAGGNPWAPRVDRIVWAHTASAAVIAAEHRYRLDYTIIPEAPLSLVQRIRAAG